MPKFDSTGPLGLGPRTGRGLGPCGRGLGYRRQAGYGFGYRRWLGNGPYDYDYGFVSPRNNLRALEEEIAEIEDEIKILDNELVALKKEKEALEKDLKG